MSLVRIQIDSFKSIKHCDIAFSELNVLIGENGTGKTNVLDAISYFYKNLTEQNLDGDIFDENNRFSNEIRIRLIFNLSEFVKISKSHSDGVPDIFDGEPVTKVKYRGYYKAIISMASKTKTKLLPIELTQIKGGSVTWNRTYEERLIIKSLFPVFHVDTRNLDITQWGYIWDVLGELGKVSNEERRLIEANIKSILLDGNKEISKKLKGIDEIFTAADVDIKTAMSKDFAKNLAKVFFSGEIIQQNSKRLSYYSTGTNSVKYIELLLKAIGEIAKTKLKEPIVLFDEPEVSLHPSYLDELADSMVEVNPKLSIVLSTHSSRLIKNIIIKSSNVTLYNVKLIDNYSHIQRMKKFPQYSPASKYRVTDEHINSYFSRAILFVEGETELELFSNPYLRLLFPKLKFVDIFQAMSQNPILNIMSPKLTRVNTPYICLIDMDKAIGYDQAKKRFLLKKEYFRENSKERFQYRNKHQSTSYLYHQRKQLSAMENALHVHYYRPFLSCDDPSYHAFIAAVQNYLKSYNVFAFKTTVEGALVNACTFDYALAYLQKKKAPADFNSFKAYWSSLPKIDRLNALRIVFNGKCDLLQSYSKKIAPKLPPVEKLTIDMASIGGKTSGWISEYLDDYFLDISQLDKSFSVKAFQKILEDEDMRKKILQKFKYHFEELYSLIMTICDMLY